MHKDGAKIDAGNPIAAASISRRWCAAALTHQIQRLEADLG
jgi:hypothetical protein